MRLTYTFEPLFLPCFNVLFSFLLRKKSLSPTICSQAIPWFLENSIPALFSPQLESAGHFNKMSRFHKPQIISAVILALFCINSSFAGPVAKPSVSIVAASAPVHIIPIEKIPADALPGKPVTTNDSETVTTTFMVPRAVSAKQRTTIGGVELVSPSNQILDVSDFDKGLNCEGSKIMCIGANQMGVMHTLRDYMSAIPHGYRYYAGQNIACMKHEMYPSPWITWGFYCAFMQGNITDYGVDGALIQLKMQQMAEHHCLGCGSVPFSKDNDPRKSGILTVNYVSQSECEGLCYYVPPGTPSTSVKVPPHMTLVQ